MKKILWVLLLFCFVSGQGSRKTWSASEPGNWGTDANWDSSAVPTDEDTVVFDATSSEACTVSSGFNIARFHKTSSGKIYLGSTSDTCSGNWVNTGGGIVSGASQIVFTGRDKYFKDSSYFYDVYHNGGKLVDSSGIKCNGDFISVDGNLSMPRGFRVGGDFIFNSDDTVTLADSCIMNGDSVSLIITNTARTDNGEAILCINGVVTYDNDYGALWKKLVIADSASFSSTGSASSGFSPGFFVFGEPSLQFLGSSTMSINSILDLFCSGEDVFQGIAPTISGSGAIRMLIAFGAAVNLSELSFSGRVSITGFIGVGSLTLSGNLSANDSLMIFAEGDNFTFHSANNAINTKNLSYGCKTTGKQLSCNFGTGQITVGKTNPSNYNSGTTVVRDSARWIHRGAIVMRSTHTYNTSGKNYHKIDTALAITNASKRWADSLVIDASGKTITTNHIFVRWFDLKAGTFDMTNDSLHADSMIKIASGATLTINASSKMSISKGGLYMGGKTLPVTYIKGRVEVFDGGTFTSLVMRSTGGDSVLFQPNKRYTFSAKPTLTGAIGAKNAWVSQTPTLRDTIDLPARDTLFNFYIRDQVFLDTVECKRSNNCVSGGGNY